MYHTQALHEVQDCKILALECDLFIELFFFNHFFRSFDLLKGPRKWQYAVWNGMVKALMFNLVWPQIVSCLCF